MIIFHIDIYQYDIISYRQISILFKIAAINIDNN